MALISGLIMLMLFIVLIFLCEVKFPFLPAEPNSGK